MRCRTRFGFPGALRVTSGRGSAQSPLDLLRATTIARSPGSCCPTLLCCRSLLFHAQVCFTFKAPPSVLSPPPRPTPPRSLSLFSRTKAGNPLNQTQQQNKMKRNKTERNTTKQNNTLTFIHERTLKQNKEVGKKKNPQIKPIPPQRFWNVF